MVSLILLPPLRNLTELSLSRDTAVLILHKKALLSNSLHAALMQHPKACVALHPVDAPLHTVILPPLPVNRQNAALRVKLEDAVLSDMSDLVLAVQKNAKNVFHVSSVQKATFTRLTQALALLGQGARTVVALSHYLPFDSPQTLGQWVLYRDKEGAGALPLSSMSDSDGRDDDGQDSGSSDDGNDGNAGNVRDDDASNRANEKTEKTENIETNVDNQTNAARSAMVFNPASLLTPLGRLPTFETQQSAIQWWQRWRWAMLLAVLCVLVSVGSTWWQWRSMLALQQQAQRSAYLVFAQALPNTPVSDMVAQLKAVSIGGNALTSALEHIPAEWPQGAVTQVQWDNKRLSITANLAVLKFNAAQQALLAEGLAAKQIAIIWSKP